MDKKVKHAKALIKSALENCERMAVACSFGKDSMVLVHLAKEVDPEIPVFSVMTMFKPEETYEYVKEMNARMNLNTKVYIVADEVPEPLRDDALTFDRMAAWTKEAR